MCCHTAAASDVRDEWPSEPSELYYQQWGRTHECVAAGASLRPGEELSWQSVTRLFSPVCLSVRQMRGPSWMGGLWLSPVLSSEPVASHLLAQCGFRTSSTLYTSSSTVWDNSSVMAMSTVKDFTHEMLTGPYYPLIDWPSFTARRGLLIGLQLPADTVTLMEENYCCLVMH